MYGEREVGDLRGAHCSARLVCMSCPLSALLDVHDVHVVRHVGVGWEGRGAVGQGGGVL